MRRGPGALVLLALLAALAAGPGRAAGQPDSAAAPPAAGAVPDSATRAALERRIGHLGSVQLVGPAGSVVLLEPVVREDGLHMRRPWKPPRAAIFVSKDAPAPPRPVEIVPWSAIEQVQVRRSGAGSGLLTGVAVGAGLAGVLMLIYHRELSSNWENDQAFVFAYGTLLVGTTATTGMLLGALGGGWRTVYPEPAPRSARRGRAPRADAVP